MSALSAMPGAPPAAARAQLRPRRLPSGRSIGAPRRAPAPARAAQGSHAAGAAAAPAAKASNKQNGTIDAARARMYEATFAGVGAPEWNNAVCVANREVLPGVRVVTLEVEVSREVVPVRGAYNTVGRQAKIKVGPNPERLLTVCSPPFPCGMGAVDASGATAAVDLAQRGVLYKLRFDQSSGHVKTEEEVSSVRANVQLWLGPKEAPEVAALQPGEEAQSGYFTGGGINLKPFLGVFRYPVVLMFAKGSGIALAKALIECAPGMGLALPCREDVRLYYGAAVDGELAFREQWPEWEARGGVKVRPAVLTPGAATVAVRGTVRDAFDADDVMYDPALTAAVVLGDEEFEKEVLELLEDAGVGKENTLLGSVEAPLVDYLRSVKYTVDDDEE